MIEPRRPQSADRRLAALFPSEDGATAKPWWRRRGGVVAVVIVVALLVATTAVATGAFGSSGGDYRLATVGTENVDSMLTGVATIEPVAQATIAFPVSGTVASVNVAPGDSVSVGGTLASLDTQTLMDTLHTKQASLAQAQLTLSKALSGQSVGGIGSGTGAGSSGTSGGSSGAATNASYTSPGAIRPAIVLAAAAVDPELAQAQQAVLAAQHQVDLALAAAASALTNETTVCASFTTTTTTTTPPTSTTTPPDATACQQAINDVATAQTAVNDAQKALATASSALDALLAQRAATPAPTPTTTPAAGTSGRSGTSGTTSSGGTGSGSSTGASSSSPSAADLIAYQSSVDSAAAAVAVAQQGVDQATIASPLAGVVVGVNMKVGDAVTSGSSTENVVVQGAGGYEVSTNLTVDAIPSVSVGQSATVLPDGVRHALTGKVVAISVTPASTSTTSTLYRVVVGLTQPGAKLENGATGTVSIVTKQAKAALAVPTSALTTVRNRHTVSVVHDGTVTVTPVQVGVVGDTWTEITSGVKTGQQVALADVSAALPGSATASSSATQGTTRLGTFPTGGSGGGTGGRFNRNG